MSVEVDRRVEGNYSEWGTIIICFIDEQQHQLLIYKTSMSIANTHCQQNTLLWTLSLAVDHIEQNKLQIKCNDTQLIIRQQLVIAHEKSSRDTRVYLHFYDRMACQQCYDLIQSYRMLSKAQMTLRNTRLNVTTTNSIVSMIIHHCHCHHLLHQSRVNPVGVNRNRIWIINSLQYQQRISHHCYVHQQ
ncbi:hypothetical protein BDF22DRAFT_734591 [Syncephalis plumigaleata]|nr:hypothetical protein BDF22DRAFT_734591 [Syncephalis plumigaleata]